MVFSIPFLHEIRRAEFEQIARHIPAGSTVLEIGAGTGFQARMFEERGCTIVALDIPTSGYLTKRVFPVVIYDGVSFPVSSACIDIVVSSNVLEHVVDLPAMQREIARVLKPGGLAIHLMPTPSWRFWTILSGWADAIPSAINLANRLYPRNSSNETPVALRNAIMQIVRNFAAHVLPFRHGERGNALTELCTFGARAWCRVFRQNQFEVVAVQPLGLFYTGHMLLGGRMSLNYRQKLSQYLGSSCTLYKVTPKRTDLEN